MILKRLLILTLALVLSGCFYMVEEGKGGVAERFPIPSHDRTLSDRLHRCEAALTDHELEGITDHYPALYRETQMRLTESRRLYKAEFYQQADLVLQPVEQVLRMMQKGLYGRAVSQLCEERTSKELCL